MPNIDNMLSSNPALKGLKDNLAQFSETRQELIAQLLVAGQTQLFENWDTPGVNDEAKDAFLTSLEKINTNYPGGLSAYISNAQILLAQAKESKNPFEGLSPEQPDNVNLSEFGDKYDHYETLGLQQFEKTAIVLVAGGLGERLGYNGIKLDIAVETLESTSYLEHYASSIKAMEARMTNPRLLPFIIMVSQDTGPKTLKTLESNNYFGLQKEQVFILQQELVPAISDNNGSLALKKTYELILKPHGHGDIHMLLYTSGLAEKLANKGIEHFVFIQDTNGQVINALPAALGVSLEKEYDFNSIAVNRIPGEAVGALAKLVGPKGELTLNVEYNQLDPLLRDTVSPEGDVPNAQGFSMFPGNINILCIRLTSYVRILKESQGIIAEFVNPKYADASKTTFKKPTRLETMMQDLPKLFGPGEKVGVTIFAREWSFSANKNNIVDAAAKYQAGSPPESSATAEDHFYMAGRSKLQEAGMTVNAADNELILGVPFQLGPKVILRPSFAMTLAEVRNKVSGGSISDQASLILDGRDIHLEGLELSGSTALIIKACDGAKVTVKGPFNNEGFTLVKLSEEERSPESTVPEYLKIRAYKFENSGAQIYEFNEPGEYTVEN
ncbi:UTP--glucose-1-phosphate uridylyltransferase [Lentisphaera profundi]|uniref:UTP-monosaccharide-1-phosphate uridylyltransferase n=1 Tax=Lentisphaera profundi TaxID=1658616 RepID=A0ABY7VQK7_9BACT|nr:UTP--glucose-1-phosphate uridylyltransferase [Lentisphaera profundi]WDE96121.1 UTP--glucose-1-phosphate uridylyltransferase [Lentisphaera profundi]